MGFDETTARLKEQSEAKGCWSGIGQSPQPSAEGLHSPACTLHRRSERAEQEDKSVLAQTRR